MKIAVFAVFGLYLAFMWARDLVMWCRSVGSKDYNWRLADFCLTSAMCVALVWLAGRCA